MMCNKTTWFICAFLLALGNNTSAQLNLENRVEIELSYSDNNYQVALAGKSGVILYRENDEQRGDDKKTWEFSLYDTLFNRQWTRPYDFPKEYRIAYHTADKNSLYLLFDIRGHAFEKVMYKITFQNKEMEVTSHFIRLPRKYYVWWFKVAGDYAYFKGTLKRTSILSCLNLADGKFSLMPATHSKRARIDEMVVDKDGKTIDVVVGVSEKRASTLYIEKYEGTTQVDRVEVKPEGKSALWDGRIAGDDSTGKSIIGTYYLPKGGLQGLFYAYINSQNIQEQLKYYSFTEFKNLFSHYSNKSQKRIEDRVERRSKKGKLTRLISNVLLHPIVNYNNQDILIGEVYYATYRTETYPCNMNGRPMLCTRQVFDGWAYSLAFIVAFDKGGNFLWDNIIEMGDIKSFTLKQMVKVSLENEEIVLAYASPFAIQSKVIRGSQITEGKRVTQLKPENEKDQLRSGNSEVEYWYDNNFLAWGSQKVKNKEEKKKRYIFFFSRLSY